MKRVIRRLSRQGYKHIAKPLLFREHPDKAHAHMIIAARGLQKVRLTGVLNVWRYQSPRLEQELLGIRFKNPIGMSAGLDKNFDLPPIAKRIGLGFEIGGSTTAHVCAGNPRPWFKRLPSEKSIVVNVGLANNGIERNIERIRSYPRKLWRDFSLSVSVAKTNSPQTATDDEAIEDYCASLRLLESANAAPLYEVNVSCPNTYGGEPFTTPARLEKLLSAIDELHLTKPVFIKLPTDKSWTQFKALLRVADKHRVAGLTIGNLVKNRAKLKHPDELSSDVKGNLSGLPAQKITTELIYKTYEAYRDRFVIIGVGGVFTAADAYEKICAGASLVAMVTALMFEGPQVVGEINEGLVKLLDRDGFATITEAIGSAHRS